ncbi:MAG: Uma2 family endonuclease [Oscillochloris sp.]|nr:Uma2 family endonuclease [Oscillochloris sp.]
MSVERKRKPTPELEIQYHLPPEDLPLVDLLVTEDDEPVDNWYSERQRWLFSDPLYAGWRGGPTARPFVAASDIGLFYALRQPPVVPDAFLSLDVQAPPNIWREGRAYFFWVYGKPPDVVCEVVSNKKGGEVNRKIPLYAQLGIRYYIILDPMGRLRQGMLRLYELTPTGYQIRQSLWMPDIGLGLTLWRGEYQGFEQTWLRWCDEHGTLYATAAELADQERIKADQEHARAERLAERLRALGIDPDQE